MKKDQVEKKCGGSNDHLSFGTSMKTKTGGTLFGVVYEVEDESNIAVKHDKSSETNLVATEEDVSSATFTLADPDSGDYFVVSVWYMRDGRGADVLASLCAAVLG